MTPEMMDPETMKVVQGAAQTFKGLDALRPLNLDRRVIDAAAGAFNNFSAMNLVDLKALQDVANSFAVARPIVAPQVSEAVAAAVGAAASSAVGDAHAQLARDLTKVIAPLDLSAVIQPRLAETLRPLSLPPAFMDQIAEVRDRQRPGPAGLVAAVQKTAEDAVALAEANEVAEVVDAESGGLDNLSPRRRRMLALDIAVMIAAFLMLAAWLAESADPRDPKGAGIALACAASLIRVCWRLEGKLD
jgi:hypothetical protein